MGYLVKYLLLIYSTFLHDTPPPQSESQEDDLKIITVEIEEDCKAGGNKTHVVLRRGSGIGLRLVTSPVLCDVTIRLRLDHLEKLYSGSEN